MTEVQDIKTGEIDPTSTVNVRRQGVEENVEKVAASIQRHGYWPDMAIVIRPHPNSESSYKYEHVTGQCRFKACLNMGLETIPAFVLQLSDDEAIQRSWLENEVRGDLTYTDRAFWTERIFKKYSGEGYTAEESIEKAAEYLGVTKQTVMGYYALVALPGELREMVDQGTLPTGVAVVLVRNTHDVARYDQSQETMKERASWLLDLDRDRREEGIKAIRQLGHSASIEELAAVVDKKMAEAERVIPLPIPSQLHDQLLAWGRARGLHDEATIVGHMIASVLRTE